MKNRVSLFSFFILLITCSVFYGQTTNTKATSDFYDALVKGNKPNLAGLTLFMTNMPKGGDLHHHYTGSIYAETYLDWVKQKNWRINSCSLRIYKNAETSNNSCPLITVDELMANDSLHRVLLTLWSDKDFHNHFHNQPPPDANFFNTFSYFSPISNNYMHTGLEIIKKRAIEENVSYIETMLSTVKVSDKNYFSSPEKWDKKLNEAYTQKEVDQLLQEIDKVYLKSKKFIAEVDTFVAMVEKVHQGVDDENFTMRFQSYGVRVKNPLQVYTDLLSAYLACKKTSLLVGVNILSPENNQTALDNYTLHMRMYNYLERKYPTISRALHAGELTLGMVRPKDLLFHIREAVEIAHAERIGHGIDLPYEKNSIELLQLVKEKSVIEINLTSNEFILGVEDNEHPYLIYSKYDVPLVISTDDSGVSRNNLTNEYVLLASRYKPSYETIKEYTYNSIKYSFLTKNEKDRLVKDLDKRFEEFEKKISLLIK